MTCQEVMEYMQRELDGDLSELEARQLSAHIRHCAECAAMYERLNRLSAELESLPKVAPPVSLVDAILPRLEAIDRTRAAKRDGTSADSEGTASPSVRRRRNNRFSLRIASGVVAAGVVAGIFMVTFNSDRFGGDSMNTAMEASSGASGSGPRLLMDAAADGSQTSGSASLQVTGSGGVDEALSSMNTASSTSSDDAQPASEPASHHNADAEAGLGSGSAPDRADGLPEQIVDMIDQSSEDSVRSKDADRETGIIASAAPIESVSPDGAYTAVLAEGRITVYDSDSVLLFEGSERLGTVVSMEWTDDGTIFRYEVERADGSVEIYRVDPAAGTESREQQP